MGTFLGDLALRRTAYDEAALHRATGRYGAGHPTALVLMALGTAIGWGRCV